MNKSSGYLSVDMKSWIQTGWKDYEMLLAEIEPKTPMGWEPICQPNPFLEMDDFKIIKFETGAMLFEVEIPNDIINDKVSLNSNIYYGDIGDGRCTRVLQLFAGDVLIVSMIIENNRVDEINHQNGLVLIEMHNEFNDPPKKSRAAIYPYSVECYEED